MTAIRGGSEPGASTATACTAPHQHRRDEDGHGSVKQLSVPLITAIAGACLVNRDALADIKPSFENDTKIVSMPPEEAAFSNCEKVVERDVEVYRKKA
jgi:hypothetical protein